MLQVTTVTPGLSLLVFAGLAGGFHHLVVVLVDVGEFHGGLEGVGPKADRVLLLIQGGGAGEAAQHRDGVLYPNQINITT